MVDDLERPSEAIAVGYAAKKMAGKTSDDTFVINPISEGVVLNIQAAALMLREFLAKIISGSVVRERIKAVLIVPCGIEVEHKKTLQRLLFSLGINECYFVPSPLACASNFTDLQNSGLSAIMVNIGGSVTDIAAVNKNTILYGFSMSIGGNNMDSAICQYVEDNFKIFISTHVAEKVKIDAGSLYENDGVSAEFSGADCETKNPRIDVISAYDIKQAIQPFYDQIIQGIENIINKCSPDVVSDIAQTGIYVCGGGAKITGLDTYLTKKLSLPVHISDEPHFVPARGLGKLLSAPEILNKIVRK